MPINMSCVLASAGFGGYMASFLTVLSKEESLDWMESIYDLNLPDKSPRCHPSFPCTRQLPMSQIGVS